MNFLIENWFTIVAVLAVVTCVVIAIVKFIKSGTAAQLSNLKEWLLYATIEAEKALGSGTGQLKLRTVYDMFLAKFPWLAKIISFEKFSDLVDDALENMNELLSKNSAVQSYVGGDEENADKEV